MSREYMTENTCDNCGKVFAAKGNLTYHISNKVCKKGRKYRCKYCPKSFSHQSSAYRHMNSDCDNRPDDKLSDDLDKEEILNKFEELQGKLNKYEEMESRIKKLEKENETLKLTKVCKSINNGIINNGDGDINFIVNIVPFGKEDLSRMNREDILNAFRCGFNSTLRLTETTHFNPKYPQFHNVYISSMKNKYAMTYDGNDWELVMKDDLIDQLYDNKREYIEENLDEFLDSLTNGQIKALQRWMNAEDNHHYVKKIKNDMKLMLYNKRKIAINSKYQRIETIDDLNESQKEVMNAKLIKTPKHRDGYNDSIIKRKKGVAPRNGRYRKIIKRLK
jgi:Zinc finger, C2H2 type